MKTFNIQAAKTHLSRLVEQACAGEEIVIARDHVPLVRLVPVGTTQPDRRFGAYRELGPLPESFFDPLPDEELDVWEGARR
jgi:antitoxin (DNA-binding transcriptional repressor) of toxin-antitoxin stability system